MTYIEWTDKTLNFQGGCKKVSPGCDNCYAIKMSNRHQANFLKNGGRGLEKYVDTVKDGEWTDRINANINDIEGEFAKLNKTKPQMVFINSMSDLFHRDVPSKFIINVYNRMLVNNHHIYQILTKRPERALEFYNTMTEHMAEVFPNLWFGVSVENQKWLDKRYQVFKDIPAAVKFVSFEPLLERIIIPKEFNIDWSIIGCESGHNRRPCDIKWVRYLYDQFKERKIKTFIKQLDLDGKVIKKIEQFPKDLQIQEFPS